MAAERCVFASNLLETCPDVLAHHSTRPFYMRGGSAVATRIPHRRGQLFVQKLHFPTEVFHTPTIIEPLGFCQFLGQLAKPASIVAMGLPIERISRIAKVVGLESLTCDLWADHRRGNWRSFDHGDQLANVESLPRMRQQIRYVGEALDIL